ncbi:hypothetical protein KMS_R32140 [Pseudomonas sp. LRP2-20]|uniref:hypothetical protein n=1 Tax=Pseudomonas sp. LRP2-20 TaxID=2944234 RepID=UPI002188AE09|nr:hypothetical protein [Pseudomonas sp. LRP2-20]BDM23457.1 hypothetical protein KMS_R32140 [Pseudomonas sp. LRP2-20]
MMASLSFNHAFIAVPCACLFLGASLTFAQPLESLNEAVQQLGDYQKTLEAQRDKLETVIAEWHEKAQEFDKGSKENIESIKAQAADSADSGCLFSATVASQEYIGKFKVLWNKLDLELQQMQSEYRENLTLVRELSATLLQAQEAAEPVAGE